MEVPHMTNVRKFSFHLFTLTELLVVISILAVLCSFLQPALLKAVNTAKITHCLNNLKQIGSAVHAYTQEHSDYMPISIWDKQYLTMHWAYEISPYLSLNFGHPTSVVSIGTVLECPSHNFSGKKYNGNDLDLRYGGYGQNYEYMGYLEYGGLKRLANWERKKISQATSPAESFYCGDSLDFTQDSPSYDMTVTNSDVQLSYLYPFNFNPVMPFEYRRHRNGCNLFWLDGHVSNMLWDEVKAGKNGDRDWYFKLIKAP